MNWFGRRPWDRVQFALAAVSLCVALVSFLDVLGLLDLLASAKATGVPLTALEVVLALNWSTVQPWHWGSLPSAALTVALFFWISGLRTRLGAGDTVDFIGFSFQALLWVARGRNLMTYAWIAIALYGFLALASGTCKIPGEARFLLEWHFGPAGCGGE